MTEIRRAAELLRAGRLVAFPTETVYGLGANALDEAAVRRIFEAKGRPFSSPLIVHVASIDMARDLALEWPEKAGVLALRFWPGPLTLVVPKRADIADVVTAGLPSVGLRIPAHPLAQALLEAAQIPIAAPSANRFTELSPTTAEHVREGLGSRVDLILDGGPCTVGIESTVISFAGTAPRILRPGMITRTQIEDAIGPVEIGGGAESQDSILGITALGLPLFSGLRRARAEGRGSISTGLQATPRDSTACFTIWTAKDTTGSRSNFPRTLQSGRASATASSGRRTGYNSAE